VEDIAGTVQEHNEKLVSVQEKLQRQQASAPRDIDEIRRFAPTGLDGLC